MCHLLSENARVAELVDALVLGTSALCMGVRVPPLAPVSKMLIFLILENHEFSNKYDLNI